MILCVRSDVSELLYNVKFQKKEPLLSAVKIGDVPTIYGWIQIWSAGVLFLTNSTKLTVKVISI